MISKQQMQRHSLSWWKACKCLAGLNFYINFGDFKFKEKRTSRQTLYEEHKGYVCKKLNGKRKNSNEIRNVTTYKLLCCGNIKNKNELRITEDRELRVKVLGWIGLMIEWLL